VDEKLKEGEIYLLFGAVDESCIVYINGKETGRHLFQKEDDWKTPFSIRIDGNLVPGARQLVVVRVEDKLGAGGIWRPVWLAIDGRQKK
jgi:hypothetical protein